MNFVNKEYFLSVMRHLPEAIHIKRPELWADNSGILHHDNAPSHVAPHGIHLIYHRVTWVFPKLKKPLRGNGFGSIEEIKREMVRALKTIPTDNLCG